MSATASASVTLEPGDVITTGMPSGVGVTRNLRLHHGDVVRVAIDGLGEIVSATSTGPRCGTAW